MQLYLLISGYRNIDTLNTELAQEILNLIGFTQNQEELKARDGINDNWFVLGKQVTEEAQLTIERNWLYGTESGRYALIMQFYVRGAGKGIALTPGTCTVAELVFFNPALSDRALIKIQHNVNNKGTVKGFTGWTDVIDRQVQMSEKNPFAGDMPFIVEQVRPVQYQGRWWLQDHERKLVQMNMPDASLWQFMAMSGGHPGTVAVVGRENEYTPLGTWHNKNYIAL